MMDIDGSFFFFYIHMWNWMSVHFWVDINLIVIKLWIELPASAQDVITSDKLYVWFSFLHPGSSGKNNSITET